ncbi:glutamyl-tRNA synthetase [Candidatus Protochlamydia naegleriophila]|uniref:Glutamate--tRNA ligase n=1 Tax=Candidatus Protochlamydia naegleriophila TaxID=389348 RepID=A0A0U5CMR7_9BACT|nr:glutamate--tRNA ligase [Candidatus Protochlamydia naegleriophila]CUI15900.1 glutamyl-tRNA synthetase [Candidatus Protochlamydia naegleriophila]
MSVRVRIAPSPTGDPHVGTAYMALFNMIFARHHKGQFILRIEDTDRTRSRPEYEENIYSALRWANIQWDEGPDVGGPFGPYRQSERFGIYKQYAEDLLAKGKAYKCFCTAEDLDEMRELMAKQGGRQGYDRRCRHLTPAEVEEREQAGIPYVIRLKVPLTGECVYEDAIKGRMTFPWADVDDQVLLKSDGFPTYHLANVVDDHLMQISHVIRGDEWMSSTPKHILLYESFGWTPPTFMHMPLLLGRDGKKLSKRKNPTSIFFYRDSGYLPEAFLNFLTLMGYSMTGDREIYSLDDIIQEFDYKRIGVSGAVFDVQKLDWVNQQYLIKNIPVDQLWNRMKEWSFNDEFMQRLMPLCHSRIKTFGDFMDLFNFLFINHIHYSDSLFEVKDLAKEQVCYLIQAIIWRLDELENWTGSGVNQASREVAEIFGVNHKKVIMPILFGSLMGKTQGPPLFDSVTILGKDRTRARFLKAMEFLGGISNKKMSSLKKAWQEKSGQALMAKE